jgi:galactofuranose transport system substrate-binding protein
MSLPPFRALYDGFYDFVSNSALRLGVASDSVDDVVQDVFLVAHARMNTIEQPERLRSWLYSVVRRTASTHRRGEQRRNARRSEFNENATSLLQPSPLDLAQLSDGLRLLLLILRDIDPLRREVFVLAELEEMTVPEIAEALAIPLNTAYSRLRNARQDFNVAFEQHARSPERSALKRAAPSSTNSSARQGRLFARKARIGSGFSQIGAESAWRMANSQSIIDEAQRQGIVLRFCDAQQKQENQFQAIRSFIRRRVDVIAFSPVVETGWEPVLREAQAAEIPVILTDRTVDAEDTSLWVTFMGSDLVEEGRRAARWLVNFAPAQELAAKRAVNIAELQGTPGSAPAIDRKRGFEAELEGHPNWKVIRSQAGDFTRTSGKRVMEAFLKSDGGDIDVLFAHNDDMAIGAIEAIEEAGLKPGKDIFIVSVDGVKDAFAAMMAGKLNCTVECSPLLGPTLMSAVKDLMAGKTLPKRILTQESVFPAEVAASEFPNRKY